nr:hypothetical protein [Tanacetum cinerariifolium]
MILIRIHLNFYRRVLNLDDCGVIVRHNLFGIEADFPEEAFRWCRRLELSSFQQSGWLVEDLDNYHFKESHCSAQCLTQLRIFKRMIPRLVIILEGEMCTSGIELRGVAIHICTFLEGDQIDSGTTVLTLKD